MYLGKGKSKASTSNPADELYEVMFRAKQEEKGSTFIRALKVLPDPAVVLATDRQLRDLNRFCTNPSNFCVMTVDPTFSLGEFDVTPITYRNLVFQSRRTGKPPICIGPVMVHYRKTCETYLFFASGLVGMSRGLDQVQAFGTDGEQALSDAFSHEFSSAVHLMCSIHMQRNIKQKLIELRIPESVRNQLLTSVCGKQRGNTLHEGLIDASTSEEFEYQLDHLQEKWEEDVEQDGVLEFFAWFRKYKAGIIKRSMIKEVQEEAGLGSPPERFTTNASESLNAVMKAGVHYRKNELPAFIQKLHKLVVEEQEREFEQAVIDRGKYQLQPQYSHLQIPEHRWFSQMSEQQKAAHLKKVAETELIESPADVHTDDDYDSVIMQGDAVSQSLSTDVHATGLPIPQGILDGIWKKASELLSLPGAIGIAPGLAPQARTVISKSRSGFHTIVPGKAGRFSCDCPNYKSLNVCAHTVAIAEINNVLPQFIAWVKKTTKVGPNLTKLLTSDMPAGRGRKGNQAPRKREKTVEVTNRVKLLPTLPGASHFPSSTTTTPPPIAHPFGTPWPTSLYSSSLPTGLPRPPALQSPSAQTGMSAIPPPLRSLPPASIGLSALNVQGVSAQTYTGNMYNTMVLPSNVPTFSYAAGGTSTATMPQSQGPPPLVHIPSPFSQSSQPDSFDVVFLGNRVKKCYGCGKEFARRANGTVLDPPHDLVIRHADHREYFCGGEKKTTKRKQNTYFHPCTACIKSKCPNFTADQLSVATVSDRLTPVHLSYLQGHFF